MTIQKTNSTMQTFQAVYDLARTTFEAAKKARKTAFENLTLEIAGEIKNFKGKKVEHKDVESYFKSLGI